MFPWKLLVYVLMMTVRLSNFEIFVQVNSDLKKLLVASVGDDLHWKLDALVRYVDVRKGS